MSVNSENELKWEIGTSEPLTIMGAEMEESQFGSKFVVRIKPLILGHDHFIPAPGLKKKIEEANVDVGDVITIEKVAPTEQWQYGYFNVSVVEKGKGPQIAKERTHKSIEKFEKQFEPENDKMTLHELTLRVDKWANLLAQTVSQVAIDGKRVDKLEKIEETRSSEAGHKPGDEKLPL